jgi:hypothetical protein
MCVGVGSGLLVALPFLDLAVVGAAVAVAGTDLGDGHPTAAPGGGTPEGSERLRELAQLANRYRPLRQASTWVGWARGKP